MNPDLLILSATPGEIAPFLVDVSEKRERVTRSGYCIISGSRGDKSCDILITGPGVFNAAQALTAYLEQSAQDGNIPLKPGLIVQIGIAGVFKQTGLNIGDLACATSERYLHTGVESNCIKNDPLPFALIEKDPLTAKGLYPFHETRVDYFYQALAEKNVIQNIGVKKGPFLTVSAITGSFETAGLIYQDFLSVMENMEGAASAHVAAIYELPMIELRAASNFVGERNKANWNIDLAVKNLAWGCRVLFDTL